MSMGFNVIVKTVSTYIPSTDKTDGFKISVQYTRHHGDETPSMLFKYKSVTSKKEADRVLDILLNSRLYSASVSELNDKNEGKGMTSIFSNKHSKLLGINPYIYMDGKEKRSYTSESVKSAIDKCKITSLSESCFIDSMWSSYCSDGQGVCIGMLTDNLIGAYTSNCILSKINYIEKEDLIKTFEFYNKNALCTLEKELSSNAERIRDAAFERLLLKYSDWAYEKEWRIINYSNNDKFINIPKDNIACLIINADCLLANSTQYIEYIRYILDKVRHTNIPIYLRAYNEDTSLYNIICTNKSCKTMLNVIGLYDNIMYLRKEMNKQYEERYNEIHKYLQSLHNSNVRSINGRFAVVQDGINGIEIDVRTLSETSPNLLRSINETNNTSEGQK